MNQTVHNQSTTDSPALSFLEVSAACYFAGHTDWSAIEVRDKIKYPVRYPLPLPGDGRIQSIDAGHRHAVIVAPDGSLYGIGRNQAHQLHESLPEANHAWVRVPFPTLEPGVVPVEVGCGNNHTTVRLTDGKVYSRGDNTFKQLGHVPKSKRAAQASEPRWERVVAGVDAMRIFVAGDVNFLLSRNGDVFSWGKQRHGHLGHGTTGETQDFYLKSTFHDVEQPTKIAWFAQRKIRIVDIAASETHVLMMSKNDVYAIGDGSNGKLGQDSTEWALEPTRVVFHDPKESLVGIAAGKEISLCLRHVNGYGNVVYFWGMTGSCGDCQKIPAQLRFGVSPDVHTIVASGASAMMISADGLLRLWGYATPSCPFANALKASDHSKVVHSQSAAVVDCMQGKHATRVVCGGTFFIVICDDAKWRPGPSHETSTKHVMVSKSIRARPQDGVLALVDRFEEQTLAFFSRVLGGNSAEAAKIFAEVPEASPLPSAPQLTKKRGASKLNLGSKVRVWMDDVYALGAIKEKNVNGEANIFLVQWLREDWDEEEIELMSDDETLDEENPARWQNLWFLSSN